MEPSRPLEVTNGMCIVTHPWAVKEKLTNRVVALEARVAWRRLKSPKLPG